MKSVALAVCLASTAMLVQLAFLQRYLDHDQVVYIKNIRAMDLGSPAFYNPHHLHFELGGHWFARGARFLIANERLHDLAFLLRLRSIMMASFGLVGIYLLARIWTESHIWATISTLAVFASHGFLHYSAKIDTGIFPASIFPWLLLGVHAWERSRSPKLGALIAGILFTIGIAFHQYLVNLPALAAIVLFVGGIGRGDSRRLLTSIGTMLLTSGIITALMYLYAGRVHHGLGYYSPGYQGGPWAGLRFGEWLFAYRVLTPYGRGLSDVDPVAIFRGYSEAFVSPMDTDKFAPLRGTPFDFTDFLASHVVLQNATILVALGVLAGSVLFVRGLHRSGGAAIIVLLLSWPILMLAAVAIESHYFEFWIIPAQCTILMGVVLLSRIVAWSRDRLSGLPLSLIPLAALCGVLVMFGHNANYALVPLAEDAIEEGLFAHDRVTIESFKMRSIYRDPYDPCCPTRQAPALW